MFSVPAISLLVYQAAEVVSRRAKARRQIKLETMLALASEQAEEAKRQKLNCSAVAENLSNKARDENWDSVQLSHESIGLSKFQDAAKPSHRLGELLSVNRCKAKKIVDASTEELKSRSIQDSTARSTKSGLRLWQSFATDFLDYDNLATLSPRSGSDVCKFVYLFNNHGTCANYISHLRWACNNQNVNMEWDTGELKQAMKGIGQLSTFYFQGPLGCIFLMTEPQCFLVTAYYRGKRDWDMVACMLLGWEMLLRMQSEGLCVYRGQDGDIFGDNHNGVWVCPYHW